MGLFDKFKSTKEVTAKDKKPKHVVAKDAAKASKVKAEDAKKKQFAAVPSADAPSKKEESKAAPKSDAKKQAKRSEDTGNAYRVLVRAMVSEKSTLQAARGQYAFAVAPTANKIEVGRAIQSLYGVRPQKINIVNYRGKYVRYGRTEGRSRAWKKAIVTLQPGQKLDLTRA